MTHRNIEAQLTLGPLAPGQWASGPDRFSGLLCLLWFKNCRGDCICDQHVGVERPFCCDAGWKLGAGLVGASTIGVLTSLCRGSWSPKILPLQSCSLVSLHDRRLRCFVSLPSPPFSPSLVSGHVRRLRCRCCCCCCFCCCSPSLVSRRQVRSLAVTKNANLYTDQKDLSHRYLWSMPVKFHIFPLGQSTQRTKKTDII